LILIVCHTSDELPGQTEFHWVFVKNNTIKTTSTSISVHGCSCKQFF